MINEKLLAKFLMDECTENELCEIKRWMDESNEHAFELFTIEELYQLGKTGFSTRATDVDRAEQMLFKHLYLQLIIPQYFISNKSGIWSLSLIVHSKG